MHFFICKQNKQHHRRAQLSSFQLNQGDSHFLRTNVNSTTAFILKVYFSDFLDRLKTTAGGITVYNIINIATDEY